MNERYKDYFRLLVMGIGFFLLETAVLPMIPFAWGKPNFLLLFVAAVGFYVGLLPGMLTAVVMGAMADALFSPLLGPWIIIYLTVAWIFIRIRESEWEAEKIYLAGIMGLVTVLTYLMMAFLLFFFGYQYHWMTEILPFAASEAVANIGFWIVLLWLFPKVIREAGKDYMSALR
jgi:rod shape-determining protein MreD